MSSYETYGDKNSSIAGMSGAASDVQGRTGYLAVLNRQTQAGFFERDAQKRFEDGMRFLSAWGIDANSIDNDDRKPVNEAA